MCNSYEQQVAYAAYRKAIEANELATPASETAADLPQADDSRSAMSARSSSSRAMASNSSR